MQTYSHFLLTAALRKPLAKQARARRLPALRTGAIFLGSVIPDLLLILLTVIFAVVDLARGVNLNPDNGALGESLVWRLFDDWFFTNPWVITAQNLFHSPLLVALFIGAAYLLWRRGVQGAGWFFWLSCAAMLHTLIDIPLHHDDGPLLLFPLNWSLRFESPVSYWDTDYYGAEFFVFEHLLDLALGIYLLVSYVPTWWKRRRSGQAAD